MGDSPFIFPWLWGIHEFSIGNLEKAGKMWDVCKVAEHVGIVLNYVGKMLNHVGKTLNYVGKFSNHVGILKIVDRVFVISNKITYKLAFNN